MKAFGRFFAQLAFYTISIGLLVYAASRSMHFIQASLDEDSQILGLFALLATSGGMLGWLAVFLYHADGLIQKSIALLMVLVDFLGEAALFTMDTLQQAGANGVVKELTQSEARTVLIGMSILIALNILAGIAYHLGNMEIIRQMAEGAQKDILFFKSLAEIEKNTDDLARTMAPSIASEWKSEFTKNYGSASKLGLTGGKSDVGHSAAPVQSAGHSPIKLRLPRFNILPWKKTEKPAVNSQPAFFPFTAKLQITVGDHTIKLGEQLEATMGANGNYTLRTPGTAQPIGELNPATFIQLFTGNDLTVPIEIPAPSSNGHHPSSSKLDSPVAVVCPKALIRYSLYKSRILPSFIPSVYLKLRKVSYLINFLKKTIQYASQISKGKANSYWQSIERALSEK
jgi:hypothetical protein